jgi:hypothetical protein
MQFSYILYEHIVTVKLSQKNTRLYYRYYTDTKEMNAERQQFYPAMSTDGDESYIFPSFLAVLSVGCTNGFQR